MRFSCDKCSARYTIADEKVRGKIVAVKCSKCGNKITVNGKSLALQQEEGPGRTKVASVEELLKAGLENPEESEAARAALEALGAAKQAAPEPVFPDGWHAIIDRQQLGPLSAAEFKSYVEQGKVNARTYVWRDGQGEWARAADVPEVAAVLSEKPAPPVPDATDAATRTKSSSGPAASRAALTKSSGSIPAVSKTGSSPGIPKTGSSAGITKSAGARPAASRMTASFGSASAPPTSEPLEGNAPPVSSSPFDASPTSPGGDPAKAAAAGEPSALGSLLFDDAAEAPAPQESKPLESLAAPASGDAAKPAGAPAKPGDPFASVPDSPNMAKPAEFGEATRFFMKQAGVTRRNPAWKIALFVVSLVGLPVALLYALSQFNVGFLKIDVPAGADQDVASTVSVSVFSSDGFSALRDKLLKKQAAPQAAPAKPASKPAAPKPAAEKKPSGVDEGPVVAKANIDMGSTMSDAERQRMKDALNDRAGDGTGPAVEKSLLEPEKPQLDGKAGLDEKVIAEAFGKNIKAFQGCVETELRRNPNFRGGKVKITFTIGTSGIVTKAAIDRADIEQSTLGACLRDKAKRMIFPAFEGEPFEVETPLVLSNGG